MIPLFSKTTDKFQLVGKCSEDKLKLFIDVEPLPDVEIDRNDILTALREFMPVDEVDRGVIESIAIKASEGEKVEQRRIAKGVPPEKGADGKLLLLIKAMTGEVEVQVDDKGFAQFTEMHLFDNVTEGQVVGRLYGPKDGVDGVDCVGNPIPSEPGKALEVSIDETLHFEDSRKTGSNYRLIVSNREGFVAQQGNSLTVKTELVISGNVDFHTGSIDFIGSVKIEGDVMPGFRVQAKKKVEIEGAVRASEVISKESDVIVKGIVYGADRGKVICAGDFHALGVEQLVAQVKGNIFIEREIVDSRLRCEGAIYAAEAQVLGGELRVVDGLEARIVGNEAEQPTVIALCSDVETTTEYLTLLVKLENHTRAEELLRLHLGPLVDNPHRIRFLQKPHREHMAKLYKKLIAITNSNEKLRAKKEQLLSNGNFSERVRVNFKEKLFPGVELHAGLDAHAVVEEAEGPGTLLFEHTIQEFSLRDYQPLKPPDVEDLEDDYY